MKSGQILQNRYLIEKQIGVGGMGAVYLGVDQRFGSLVAIKESIAPDSPRLSRAFEHEAQLLNSLRHPALPHVVDYFVENDCQFIVMEYIDGEDLTKILERRGAFAVTDVLRWADDLLDALEYLHNQKFPVIHRDIKPQNLKITSNGKIILLDFGLAKGNPAELSQLTISKSIFGYSRIYAPLEQIQGTGTDVRSDLYSLAATLYHLLTGHAPVDALTRAKSVLSDESDLLKSIVSSNQKVPRAVAEILHQALALNANVRPSTAAEMRAALKNADLQIVNSKISDQPIQNNAQENLVYKVSNFENIKNPKVESEQIKQPLPVAKQYFPLSSGASFKIAAAALIMFGIGYTILDVRSENLRNIKANSVSTEKITDQAVVNNSQVEAQTTNEEQNSLAPVAEVQIDSESVEAKNENVSEEKSSAQPTAVLSGSIKSKRSKPVPVPRSSNAQKSEDNIAVRKPLATQRRETTVPKSEKTEETNNRKDKGFKGFLNKIGAGAMRFPKSIFKKKKD